jgi:hypothetical protein
MKPGQMPEIIDEKPEIIDVELGEFPASKEGNGRFFGNDN